MKTRASASLMADACNCFETLRCFYLRGEWRACMMRVVYKALGVHKSDVAKVATLFVDY